MRWRRTICLLAVLLFGCDRPTGPPARSETGGPPATAAGWYRGNTHTHSRRVTPGAADARQIVRWYRDHGYRFLVLSEHRTFVSPRRLARPDDAEKDFLLIGGQEMIDHPFVHATAFNIDRTIPPQGPGGSAHQVLQGYVDKAHRAGGLAIVAHPNYRFAVKAEDLLRVKGLRFLEIYNGHPAARPFASAAHGSAEAIWDRLLGEGMRVYGVAADDARHFETFGPDRANPGRGWIAVRAEALTPAALAEAMARGDFYASTGVHLSRCDRTATAYRVTVDATATERELARVHLRGHLNRRHAVGMRVQFLGPGGKVLSESEGPEASHAIDAATPYVRARIVVSRPADDGRVESFYAWGQPVFSTAR